jgi:hypothetical protein
VSIRTRVEKTEPAGSRARQMLINVALQDGFDRDTVVIRVDGSEAYRGEQVTTRTQISHADDMQLEVPERPFALEVEVPDQGVRESLELDPRVQPNVALSLRDGQIVAKYPERLGFM